MTPTLAAALVLCVTPAPTPTPAPGRTYAEVLAASPASDWEPLDPATTLYLQLPAGRVVIVLAPEFAPHHTANVLALTREKYFDGLAVTRSQDNYVVQWGDPDGKKPITTAARALIAELSRPSAGLAFTLLPERDAYAPEVGFVSGFPVARDPATGRAWLAHCYGMVGVGRDLTLDSGSGAELYAVNGHAPRHLDLNITLVGRVVAGMELLSALPRGSGVMGFYEKGDVRVPIVSVRVAADVPPTERTHLERLATGSASFTAAVEAKRNRRDAWYVYPAGHLNLCNAPLPVRPVTTP